MRPFIRSGRPANGGIGPLGRPVINRQDVIDGCHLHEEVLQLLQLRRFLRGEIVDKAEVLGRVVKLPDIVLQTMVGLLQPWLAVNRPGKPALVIDRAVSGDLEVLRQMPIRRIRDPRRRKAC